MVRRCELRVFGAVGELDMMVRELPRPSITMPQSQHLGFKLSNGLASSRLVSGSRTSGSGVEGPLAVNSILELEK